MVPETCPLGPTTLVVIPAFNAASCLPRLIAEITRHIDKKHLLVVDDGSVDATAEVALGVGVSCLSLSSNHGKAAALAAGFAYAIRGRYRSVITLDADLQHRPAEIPRFLHLDDGRRIVLGCRCIRLGTMPPVRIISNFVTSLVVSILAGCRIRDSQCGFRLIPVRLLRSIRLRGRRYSLESELLLKAALLGCSVAEVPVSTVYEESRSYISPLRDVGLFIAQVWKRLWV